MKIEINISERNEGTAAPYWLILNPQQMMKPDCYILSGMIKGLFFSREEATQYLQDHRYNFGKHAVVFCLSGNYGLEYRNAYEKAKKELDKRKKA